MVNEMEMREQMANVLTKCDEDKAFLAELVEAEDQKALGAVLETRGFHMEGSFLEEFYQGLRQAEQTDELSEEMLDAVAGGVLILTGYALSLATWGLVCVAVGVFIYGVYQGLKGDNSKKKKKGK